MVRKQAAFADRIESNERKNNNKLPGIIFSPN